MGGEKPQSNEAREAAKSAPAKGPENTAQVIAGNENMRRDLTTRACSASREAGVKVSDCADSEGSRLRSARTEQGRNSSALDEASAANAPVKPVAYEYGAIQEGRLKPTENGGTGLQGAIKEMVANGKLPPDQIYSFLVDYGKSLKSDPQKMKSFLNAIDAMFYGHYTEQGAGPKIGDQQGNLQKMLFGEGGQGIRMQCGDISDFMVRFADAMGYEAVSMGGVEKGVSHYATMVKMSEGEYLLLGVTKNSAGISVRANTMEEAMQKAFHIAPSFGTSGIFEIHGKDKNEFYQRYALRDALFADRADANADRNLRIDPSTFEGGNFLTPEQKQMIKKHLENAQNADLRVTGVSYYGVAETGGTNMAGGSRVVFEGFSKDGGKRTVIFDLYAAADQNRMDVLWRTVKDTTVDTVRVEVGERHLNGTDALFDTSQYGGARVEASRKTRYTPNTYGVTTGYLSTEVASGRTGTLAGDRSSNIATFVPDLSYRLVRTSGGQAGGPRVDLYVGGGARALITAGQTNDRVRSGFVNRDDGPANTSGLSASYGLRLRETVGGMVTGREGNLAYRGAVEFSLLQDRSEVDQGNQKVSAQLGTEGKAEAGFVYRVGSSAEIYGNGYMTMLRTPVFNKNMAGGTVGVTLTDVAGVRGLDVGTYVSARNVRENVTMSSLNETWRNENTLVYGGKLSYTGDGSRVGVGLSRYQMSDAARGNAQQSGNQLSVDYALFF
jgi:hypothetical protein